MKRFTRALTIVCAIGLLSACSSSGGTTASKIPSATPGGSTDAHVKVGPLTYTAQTSATATAVVTPAKGGTIKATATDGTTYTLEVVAGQVAKPVTISLVPLGNVGGIPSDSPISAVKMLPSGLAFAGPATLTIVPAKPLPAKTQTMFLADDSGKPLALAVVNAKTKTLTMGVPHFTIAGAGSFTDNVYGSFPAQDATDLVANVAAELAAALGQARQEALLGIDGKDFPASVISGFDRAQAALATAVADNSDNCDLAKSLIGMLVGMERQRQLLGMPSSNVSVAQGQEVSIYKACEKKAIKQCQDAEDPSLLTGFWLGVLRQEQLLGVEGNALPDGSQPDSDKAKRLCTPAFAAEGSIPSAPSGIHLKGKVCKKGEPFTLNASGDETGSLKFTPTSDSAGKLDYKAVVTVAPDFPADGSGSYTLHIASDKSSGQLKITYTINLHIPHVKVPGHSGTMTIDLTPTDPCS